MSPIHVGMFAGLLLGIAFAAGGFAGFALALFFAAVGIFVARVTTGDVDVSQYLPDNAKRGRA